MNKNLDAWLLISNRNIGKNEKLIMAVLIIHLDGARYFSIRISDLVELTSLSESTVKRSMSKLISEGILNRTFRGSCGIPSEYILL